MSAIAYLFGLTAREICQRVKGDLPADLRHWVSVQSANDHWRVAIPACGHADLSRFMASKLNEARFSVPVGAVSRLGECLGFTRWPAGTVQKRKTFAMIRLTPAVLTAVTVERLKLFLTEALRATLLHNNLGL